MKKWQKSIASVLAVAMLVSNFGSVTPMINAQSIETNDVNITEETSTVDTVIRLDDTEVRTDDEITEEPTTSEDDGVTDEDASTVEDKDVTDEVVGDLPSTEIESETYTLTIHYNRENGDYDGWGIHNWGSGINDDQKEFTHKDDFGYLVDIEVVQGAEFGYIIKDTDWNKNHPEDQLITVTEDTEIWVEQGQNGYHTEAPNGLTGDRVELEKPTPPEPSETRKLTLHYNRENNDYEGWDLWFWPKGGAAEAKPFIGNDEFGLVIELELNMGEEYNYIIRKDDWSDKNYPEDQKIIISEDTEIWVEQGQNGHYKVNPKEPFLTIHYNRTKADYEGWDLWWFPEGEEGHSVSFNGMDDFGLVAEIPVDLGSEYGYIIRKNDWSDKNHGSDQ
ncbi:MAG: pullulanase-associated domain-containing protein, partial [Turicibacter sp.]